MCVSLTGYGWAGATARRHPDPDDPFPPAFPPTILHVHPLNSQFYLLPNLLLCAFGIDAASETHMLRCRQASAGPNTHTRMK